MTTTTTTTKATPKLANGSEAISSSDDYYAYEDEDDYTIHANDTKTKEKNVDEVMCNRYGKGLLKWMKNNENRWSEFLTEVYFCTCLFVDENHKT
ncbi:unnamed protein product [Gongylonema pulchrum]|uniref:Uncharacterized protein n=1 Tax=Gongylonema pulchrum TaxID=637853 RepID=A0A183DC39_9BILA|nr:unnamed protein product [Gongylonema pulchrum]